MSDKKTGFGVSGSKLPRFILKILKRRPFIAGADKSLL
jgi:hypothetical protein